VTVNSELPLADVRVLAFTQLGAGPFGMIFLGDLGAEVIKVEDPTTRGDEARSVPPFNDRSVHDGLYYQSLNRGARSLTLNLRTSEGQDLLHRLVDRVDAVYNNLRGDLPARLGLDYAALRPWNNRIVCCSLSGFGRTGPRAADPGYDYLLQAYAGFMSVSGEPDAPPTKCGVSIVDFSGGILSALALMIGLHRARATGIGCDIDVSLLDTAISMLNYLAVWTLNRDWRPRRLPGGAHQSLVPSQSFRTRDGWVVIMCMKEKFWERLADRMDLGHLRDDPRFRTFADRLAHRDALVPMIEAEFLRRTTAEWLERLRGHVPIAPVHTVEEALADEQVLAREMVIEVEHAAFGGMREVGCPIKIDGLRPRYAPAAPLGADTETLLAEVGVGPAELARLRAAGII
jgi:succinate---hydroxymethylglutarate CoA-transferase